MDRVARLSELVVNQIAAGEVVERPASVVKELLENAIDAEATRVTVEITAGGLDRVKITDDGVGMSRADAVLALERHATSKLRALPDLDSLATLGFRGEALPSIASVSRFTLTTAERGALEGTEVVVDGGRVVSVQAAGAPAGTTVEVRDLFFNVPARRKFMKRPETESSHVHDAVVRLALARPHVAIKLVHNGRVVLDVPAATELDPRGRLGRIFGREVAAHLFPLEPLDGAVRVTGWAAAPELSERTTRGLYVFVNGRFVRDRTAQHAVQEGYRNLLERGRYPVVVIAVEVDPAELDVNVHPQKTEVRFATPQDVHRAIASALARTLAEEPWLGPRERTGAQALLAEARRADDGDRRATGDALLARDHAAGWGPGEAGWGGASGDDGASAVGRSRSAATGLGAVGGGALDLGGGVRGPGTPTTDGSPSAGAWGRETASRPREPAGEGDGAAGASPNDARGPRAGAPDAGERAAHRARGGRGAGRLDEPRGTATAQLFPRAAWPDAPPWRSWDGGDGSTGTPARAPHFSALEPVGQVLGTYLVCQGEGRMVLIDQHAAHERIAFERMRKQRAAGAVESQPLLLPETLTLDAARAASAEDHREALLALGFELEAFGGQTWVLKAVPRALGNADVRGVLLDVLDELRELERGQTPVDDAIGAALSCAACHTVVRAGDRLGREEIRALLVQMDEIDFGAHCPHGRPVFVEWTERQLGAMFHRT